MSRNQAQPLLILQGYIQKEFYNSYVEEYIISLRNRLRFRRACRLADAKHKENGKAYYVMNAGQRGLIVFNNEQRKEMVRIKLLPKSADHLKILSLSHYYTLFPPKTRKELEQREYGRLKTYLNVKDDVEEKEKTTL